MLDPLTKSSFPVAVLAAERDRWVRYLEDVVPLHDGHGELWGAVQ